MKRSMAMRQVYAGVLLAAALALGACGTDGAQADAGREGEQNEDPTNNGANNGTNNGEDELQAPSIDAFEASSDTVNFGDTVTLSWTLSGGEVAALSIDPDVGDVSGQDSVDVSVEASVTYTLTAQNEAGTDTATLSLTPEGGSPTVAGFDAAPNPTYVDEAVTYNWQVDSFDGDEVACRLDVDDDGEAEYEFSDCTSVSEQSHTFDAEGSYTSKLVAVGRGGEATQSITVDVDPAPVLVTSTDDTGPGTLRQAVADVDSGGHIAFDLAGQASIELDSQIVVDKDVTICGEGPAQTILDGQSQSSILQIEGDVRVTVCDLTLQNGLSETVTSGTGTSATVSAEPGGLIQAEGDAVALTLRNVVAKDATTYREDPRRTFDSGGCVYLKTGTLDVESSHFSNCFASSGGAITAYGEVRVTDSTFDNSESLNPGGALQILGTLDVRGSTFVGNHAGTGGGAFIIEGRPERHDGPRGDGTSLVVNSTFHDNDTPNGGGAIMVFTDLTVINSTFVENVAHDPSEFDGDNGVTYGGAIYVQSSGVLTLRNSILWNNDSPDGPDIKGEFSAAGVNVISTLDGATPDDASGITDAEPNLSALGDHGGLTQTFSPGASGAAVDAVADAECVDVDGSALVLDQRGESRPSGASCDVGAVEVQAD